MAQDVQWTPSISPVNDCRPQSSDICVLHWNVLASPGATTKLYPYCPAATLRTDLRSPRLVRFVQTLAPDILLLNEYEPNYHSAALAAAGYDSHFLRRTGGKVDGEAVCWDRHRYCIQEHWDVCYDDLVLEQPGSPEAANQLRTGYVGLVVRLLDLSDGARTLLVATTHLCWGSDKADTRARQMRKMLQSVRAVRHPQEPLVLSGDLNAPPQSPEYALATATCGLHSAYHSAGAEPPYTAFANAAKLCVDYIFFTPSTFTLVGVMPIPFADLDRLPGLPTATVPSDHLPLACRLRLKPPSAPPPAPGQA